MLIEEGIENFFLKKLFPFFPILNFISQFFPNEDFFSFQVWFKLLDNMRFKNVNFRANNSLTLNSKHLIETINFFNVWLSPAEISQYVHKYR